MTTALRHNIDHEVTKNGIVYKIAKTQKEFDLVMDFLFDVFCKDEPVSTSLGITKEVDRTPNLEATTMEFLQDGTSLIAIDPSKDGQLVGIRLSVTIKREDAPKERRLLPELEKQYSKNFALMFMLMDELMFPINLMNMDHEHKKLMDFIALATRDDYRGRGIAGELVNQAFDVAKKAGCDCVAVLASSPYSRRIFEKKGMKTIHKTYRVDLAKREEFKGAFKNDALDHITGHVMSI